MLHGASTMLATPNIPKVAGVGGNTLVIAIQRFTRPPFLPSTSKALRSDDLLHGASRRYPQPPAPTVSTGLESDNRHPRHNLHSASIPNINGGMLAWVANARPLAPTTPLPPPGITSRCTALPSQLAPTSQNRVSSRNRCTASWAAMDLRPPPARRLPAS
jgi:hypothetical protein